MSWSRRVLVVALAWKAEARVPRATDLGYLGVRDPVLALLVPERLGYLIGLQAASSITAIVFLMEAFIRAVIEK